MDLQPDWEFHLISKYKKLMKKINELIFRILFIIPVMLLFASCEPKAEADFDYSFMGDGYGPQKVEFKNLSEKTNEYFWDFGDGSTSTEKNPSHFYYNAGSYTVKLKATNRANGEIVSKTITLPRHKYTIKCNYDVGDVSIYEVDYKNHKTYYARTIYNAQLNKEYVYTTNRSDTYKVKIYLDDYGKWVKDSFILYGENTKIIIDGQTTISPDMPYKKQDN